MTEWETTSGSSPPTDVCMTAAEVERRIQNYKGPLPGDCVIEFLLDHILRLVRDKT